MLSDSRKPCAPVREVMQPEPLAALDQSLRAQSLGDLAPHGGTPLGDIGGDRRATCSVRVREGVSMPRL